MPIHIVQAPRQVPVAERRPDSLHEFLDTFQLKLNKVDDAIYDTFFALHPLGDKAHTAYDPLPRATPTQTQTQSVELEPRGA